MCFSFCDSVLHTLSRLSTPTGRYSLAALTVSDPPPHLRFQVTSVSLTMSPHLRLIVPLACFESSVQCAPTLPEVKAHAL
eukprot:2098523-Amphidinium_carterae.3